MVLPSVSVFVILVFIVILVAYVRIRRQRAYYAAVSHAAAAQPVVSLQTFPPPAGK